METLREAVQACQGCDLYRDATQVVFSRGGAGAPLVMVGEQPGDEEDRRGLPFVGPAGRMLVQALREVGIAPDQCYVTNVVKHFGDACEPNIISASSGGVGPDASTRTRARSRSRPAVRG